MERILARSVKKLRTITTRKMKTAKKLVREVASTKAILTRFQWEDQTLHIEGEFQTLKKAFSATAPMSLQIIDSETQQVVVEQALAMSKGAVLLSQFRKRFEARLPILSLLNEPSLYGKKVDVILRFSKDNSSIIRLFIPLDESDRLLHHSYTEMSSLMVYPYRTAFGNLSLKVLTDEQQDKLPHLANELTSCTISNTQLSLRGIYDDRILDYFHCNKNNMQLLVKRRGSETHYLWPVVLTQNEWSAIVELEAIDFTKGVWDFYLTLDGDASTLFRVQLSNRDLLDATYRFTASTDKESGRGRVYRTKQNKLSILFKPLLLRATSLHISTENGQTDFSCNFSLSGMGIKDQGQLQSMSLLLMMRDSQEEVILPLDFKFSETGTHVQAKATFSYDDIVKERDSQKKIWDAYLLGTIDNVDVRYRIRALNQQVSDSSKETYFVEESLYAAYFYLTIYKRLSFVYSAVPVRRFVTSYSLQGADLRFKGIAYIDSKQYTMDQTMDLHLIAKNRVTEEEQLLPCTLEKKNWIQNYSGRHAKKGAAFHVLVPLASLENLLVEPKEIIDFYIEISNNQLKRREKLGLKNYRYFKDDVILSKTLSSSDTESEVDYCLTITPRGNLKVETFRLVKGFKERLTNSSLSNDVWLIGERPDTAQDTGYHFFKYCRTRYPDQPVYYAIAKDSKDLKNIQHLGNVLLSGSPEHFEIASKAKVLIGSHDFDYFLPYKGIQSPHYKYTIKIFLQHGVLGRKKVEYDSKFYKYPFDVYCVSSTSEQQMVMEQQGYTDDVVRVTGLSRFDELLKNHQPKREILLIPTWREWLNTTEILIQSEYFKRYTGLLQNPRLVELLHKHDLRLNFYPHYRMQQFFEEFGAEFDSRIQLMQLGEKNVQDLLKDNSLMITDFSSVSFDFTYLSKPVVYYHFDRDSFFKGGMMRPFDETFLGDVATEEEELIGIIEQHVMNGFIENEDVKLKKSLVFDYVDQNNCDRVYNEIQRVYKKKQS